MLPKNYSNVYYQIKEIKLLSIPDVYRERIKFLKILDRLRFFVNLTQKKNSSMILRSLEYFFIFNGYQISEVLFQEYKVL